MADLPRFYQTTAIDYPNSRPHIGTAFEKQLGHLNIGHRGSDQQCRHAGTRLRRRPRRGNRPVQRLAARQHDLEHVPVAILEIVHRQFATGFDVKAIEVMPRQVAPACGELVQMFQLLLGQLAVMKFKLKTVSKMETHFILLQIIQIIRVI